MTNKKATANGDFSSSGISANILAGADEGDCGEVFGGLGFDEG